MTDVSLLIIGLAVAKRAGTWTLSTRQGQEAGLSKAHAIDLRAGLDIILASDPAA